MSFEINLLIVEDDDDQYELYYETAEDFNKNNQDFKFSITRKSDFDDAHEALLSRSFDAAIVDLNLKASEASEASGNKVLEKIVGDLRFPVFVVSGNLNMLDPVYEDKRSSFLKFYNRVDSNSDIFEEIRNIYSTGITRILGGRGEIESRLSEIFWNHLANDLDVWINKTISSEKALLRYALSHLNEYLDLSSDDRSFYEEAEFYIKPPIREHIATGDIIESKNDAFRYIVLSPACDVEVRDIVEGRPVINAKRITISKLINVDRGDFLANNIIREETNSSARESIISEIINGKRDKYHFLPEYKDLKSSVTDFQNLYAISFDEYLSDFNRIATVSGSFLKDIQCRFSSYCARQGQPDLNKDELVKKLKSKLSPIN